MTWTEVERFEEFFYHDLESWFSADIACCDKCYDDFISTWPHAYSADDCEFQRSGIPLDCFYSGSRLQESYSEIEFELLIEKLTCPRCGSNLKANIWPYNLPFDVPNDFESTINKVCAIAESTPFLLLNNDFCRDIYSAIKSISQTSDSKPLHQSLFRGRALENNKLNHNVSHFDFPPSEIVQEGRYNHSGNPALYLASDLETCVAELRGQDSLIYEFVLSKPLRILNLAEPFEAHENKADLLNSLVYSALVSAKHLGKGQYKPHYVVSRFVADCAKEAGFDAIKYPSTRRAENNYNLVILSTGVTLANDSKRVKFHDHVSSASI